MSLRMNFLPVRWKGNRARDGLGKSIKMQHPEAPRPWREAAVRVCRPTRGEEGDLQQMTASVAARALVLAKRQRSG